MKVLSISHGILVGLLMTTAFAQAEVDWNEATDQSREFPIVSPESVGVSADKVQAVLKGVRELIEDQEAVGAEVLLIKDGKVILHEAVGMRDQEAGLPKMLNTICCVRSMSKPIIGTAIQMLIDAGLLQLSDKASKFLPSFDNPKSREITIEQLLTHTSGLPLTAINKDHTTYSGQRAVADQVGQSGPTGKAGEFSYSDSGTEALTAVVAQVSGMPAEKFIKERILQPLGMKDTYCVLGKDAPDRSRVSSNYAGSTCYWHKYWDHNDPPFFPYFLGAAACYSTPMDYARFLSLWADRGMVGSKRLLSEEAIKRGLTPVKRMRALGSTENYGTGLPGYETHYGQLWMVNKGPKADGPGALPVFGHGGSDGTLALVFPEQKLMAFYFTQARGGLSVFQFEELLAPLVGLPAAPARQRLSVDKLKPLVGIYRDSESGKLGYTFIHGNRLVFELPGIHTAFVPDWPDEKGRWAFGPAIPNLALRFDRDAKGDVTKLLFLEGKEESPFEKVTPAKDLPTVEQLMAERRVKHGGDKIDALKTLQLDGKVTIGTNELDVTFLATSDGKAERILKTDKGNSVVLLVKDRLWQQSPGKRFEELTGLLKEQYSRMNLLERAGDWRKSFSGLEIVGKDKVGKEDVWVVRLEGKTLPPLTRYVGCESGRLLKEDAWILSKGVGMVQITINYSDYRDVAGVPIPFRMASESLLSGKQVVQYEKAKANQPLPDGAFVVPAGK